MKKKLFTTVAAVLLFGTAAVHGAPAAAKREMTAAERLAAVRLTAAAVPGKALADWMTAGAFNRWRDTFGPLVKSDGTSPFMTDFFAHALLLSGPQSGQSGVSALYNPLQDNLLIFQTDNVERIPRVEDFVFTTGSRFRGEARKEAKDVEAIAPVKGDLDAVLLKNTAAVIAKFRKCFPAGAKQISLASCRRFSDPEGVCGNAALRLSLLRRFVKPEAKPDALKAGEIALLLWKGERKALENYFTFPAGDTAPAGIYAALPDRVKRGMFPVLYFRNKKQEVLFGFASRVLPEALILIQIPASGKPFFVYLPLSEKFVAAAK